MEIKLLLGVDGNMVDPVKQLLIADPELALEVTNELDKQVEPVSMDVLHLLVTETIWGLTIERAFGQAIARGYLTLAGKVSTEKLLKYRDLIRATSESGPTTGRLMAAALVLILIRTDDFFLNHFMETVTTMLTKGSYTLPPVVEALDFLLESGDVDGAAAFLQLLKNIFDQPLSYNRSRHLSQIVSKAVRAFPFSKRVFQIHAVDRIVRVDIGQIEGFLESFDKGLLLLQSPALSIFVTKGLEKLAQGREAGEKFLSMASRSARDICSDLQVIALLPQVRNRLNRYLQARTGLPLAVKSLSALSKTQYLPVQDQIMVVSDGKFIYLPDEIDTAHTRAENEQIYQMLVRLEAAYYECGTHDFDFERAMESDCFPQPFGEAKLLIADAEDKEDSPSDLERFFTLFNNPQLAADLFIIFEQGRIRRWLGRYYPGILRMSLPILWNEAERMTASGETIGSLFSLYRAIALGQEKWIGSAMEDGKWIAKATCLFHEAFTEKSVVERSAALVTKVYPELAARYPKKEYRPLAIPYSRKIRPDLFWRTFRKYDQTAGRLQQVLAQKKIKSYRSDIRKKLGTQNGTITMEDIRSLMVAPPNAEADQNPEDFRKLELDISSLDFSGILSENAFSMAFPNYFNGKSFRYKEWDCRLQDYLQDHVLVREMPAIPAASDFFDSIRSKHNGLIKRIRHSFEMLKPQGLVILRKWLEGDAFDYRALIDYIIDRKAGIMPSDRIYIKRIKQIRDVSVLLLVDLSRSTANFIAGGETTVLDVEKEAIVLLCEALSVVGDRFSIAGFSGSGRLGVDYFTIKSFDEPVDETVRLRINGMMPYRSTRMGAAIRHGVSQLVQMPSKVRLLLILGDGFPNDIGYKQAYAIEDTRRALFEARGQNVHTHGITVNIATDTRMDDMYGKSRHHIIGDVRELPDKLFRIYGALTRQVI